MEAARRGAALGRRDEIMQAVAHGAERLLRSSDWRDALSDVLEHLGPSAAASRAYVVENRPSPDGRLQAVWVAEWTSHGVRPLMTDPAVASAPWDGPFSRWAALLEAGDPVCGPIREFPDIERRILESHGVRSLVSLPVTVEGAWWGSIGFDDCVAERDWTGPEVDTLRVFAVMLGAAIARRRDEEHHRLEQSRFRTFLETIPAVTYTDVVTPEGRAVLGYVSPQIESILGYPPERFIEDPGLWFGLMHPDDESKLQASGAFSAADTSTFDEEYRMLAADGRWIWVHDTSIPVFGSSGRLEYFQGFLVDITRRREAQEQLRDAEERFRVLVERIPAVTFTISVAPGGTSPAATTYISPQVEDVFGYPASDWRLDVDFWKRIEHPDDLPWVESAVAERVASGEPFSLDHRLLAADGRTVWIHEEAVLVLDANGRPQYWQGFMLDITARKQTEDALRTAEDRYRQLVEHIPAIVYQESVDANPEDLYLGPQVEEILGWSLEEWRNSGLPDFWYAHVHPDDAERVRALNEEANESGRPFTAEYRFRTKDGRWVWLRDEARVVRGPDGSPLFWQGVLLDVTDRRVATDRLAEAEERYRELVERIPAAVYTESDDADPNKFYISPVSQELFGYAPDAWRAPGFWMDHVHPEDRARVQTEDERSNRVREQFTSEYRFRAADGRWIWIHDEAAYLRHGDEEYWQGFMFDITEQKAAESRLRDAEERFRTIVEQNQAIFYVQEVSEDDPAISLTTYIAPGNTELLGYSLEEIKDDPALWRGIIHPEDRDRVLALDASSNLEEDGEFSAEYRMRHKDGHYVWIQDEARRVRIGDRPPYWQGFLLDITERKNAEEQLARSLEVEREATSRLRALDEMKNTFLQAVSHDLRTPLAAILGIAITLERGDVRLEQEDARDLAGRIAENARKLDRLVVNLLDLDRLSRGIVTPKLENTDLGALVTRAVREADLDSNDVTVDASSVVVPVDAAKVERILENLLANAARHTPRSTRVWVSVRREDRDVLLVVEDDGPGVAPELEEAIFQPFEQGPDAPRHSPGVGVGLTLVRRFAELHGGRAWVEERPGGGASFRVSFPAPALEAPARAESV